MCYLIIRKKETGYKTTRNSYKRKKSKRMFRLFFKSERRGSNSRQPAWKAGALPTELLSHYNGANIGNKFNLLQIFFIKIVRFFISYAKTIFRTR